MHGVVNDREFAKKQTIITTNLNMKQISDLYDERLASRLSAYKIIEMSNKDKRRK